MTRLAVAVPEQRAAAERLKAAQSRMHAPAISAQREAAQGMWAAIMERRRAAEEAAVARREAAEKAERLDLEADAAWLSACLALVAAKWFVRWRASKRPSLVHPKIGRIQELVARRFGIQRQDILSERRTAAIVRPRQIAMFLAAELTPRSTSQIGLFFGGRDHTTVLHALNKMAALVKTDRALAETVVSLRAELTGGAG